MSKNKNERHDIRNILDNIEFDDKPKHIPMDFDQKFANSTNKNTIELI